METFKKIINIIYYILVLVLLVLILPSVFKDYEFSNYLYNFMGIGKVEIYIQSFVIFMAVFTLIRLFVAIYKKRPQKYIKVIEGPGNVKVSVSALENMVRNAVDAIPFIEECKVMAKYTEPEEDKPKALEVYVKCGLDEEKEVILEELNFINEKIYNTCIDFIGMDCDKIDVDFYDVEPKKLKHRNEKIDLKGKKEEKRLTKRVK